MPSRPAATTSWRTCRLRLEPITRWIQGQSAIPRRSAVSEGAVTAPVIPARSSGPWRSADLNRSWSIVARTTGPLSQSPAATRQQWAMALFQLTRYPCLGSIEVGLALSGRRW